MNAPAAVAQDAFTIREATLQDVDAMAQIFFDSFNAFNASVSLPPEWPSVDLARGVVTSFVTSPDYDAWVAVSGSGRVLGSNFLEKRDAIGTPGPISVAAGGQNAGVGRALMEVSIERAQALGLRGVQGVQLASNVKSYALYASMGFIPRQQLAAVRGFLSPAAVGSVDVEVRRLEEADVEACDALYQATHGYSRRNDILASLHPMSPHTPYVALSRGEGRIVGYTTGLALLGHAVCEDEETVKALVVGVSRAMQAAGAPEPMLHVPAQLYPGLLQWALNEGGMKLLRLETLITIGDYQPPKGAVYCPGMAY